LIKESPKLTFVAAKPPPPHIAYQELLMAAETGAEYFSWSSLYPGQEVCVISGASWLFSVSSEPTFRYFELNLTSDHAAIYHS